MSVLNKKVSYYPSTTATTRGQEVNLLKLLQSNKHKERILNLRASEKEVQKQLKESLPCYTPAGRFNRRCEEGLIELSGLAAVDLDSAEQYDQLYILQHLKNDLPCIAHAGFSCRGERLYCLVVFKYPDQYQRQYARLIKSFEEYNLPMGDQCHKSISQPRYITWNDNDHRFFVHNPEPYALLASERKFYHIRIPQTSATADCESPKNIFAWCVEHYNKSHSFSEGIRHEYILGLARYCNKKGVPQQVTLNGCLSFVLEGFSAYEIEKMVTHIYAKQADSHNTIPFTAPKKKNSVRPDVKPTKEIEVDRPHASVDGGDIKPESVNPTSQNWDVQIAELESFFESATLTVEPIQLDSGTKISNVARFIEGHLATVEAQNGNLIFEPYLLRLVELKELICK